MDDRDEELAELKARFAHPTVPIVLIDGELVGGCDDLEAFLRSHDGA
jgi:glutaredoxin-related protein